MIVVLIAFTLVLTTIGIFMILMGLWDLILRIPFVPTPWPVVDAMRDITPWTGKETQVVDLGAGDGRLLECMHAAHPRLTAVGYEISPVVWLLARVRAIVKRSGVHIRFQSLFKADLRNTDIVYMYLLPSLMNKLAAKLDCELKPGTPVISHAFRFANRVPEKTMTVRVKRKDVTVLLYRW